MKTINTKTLPILTLLLVLSIELCSQTFTEQTGISLTELASTSIAWGDYDNDGDLDILLTGTERTGNVSKIYRNNGNNTFVEQTGISLTGVYNGSVDWGDYDNDDDLYGFLQKL